MPPRGSIGLATKLWPVLLDHYSHYGATPNPKPDLFYSLTNTLVEGPGHACAGVTFGDTGKLFSEYYIDKKLDEIYSIERSKIAEIGAFSSFTRGIGAGKYLLDLIIKTLTLHNYDLVVLTATKQVRAILHSIVAEVTDLGAATIERVEDPNTNWGTYYNHDPRVVVFRLRNEKVWNSSTVPKALPVLSTA